MFNEEEDNTFNTSDPLNDTPEEETDEEENKTETEGDELEEFGGTGGIDEEDGPGVEMNSTDEEEDPM